MSSSENIIVFDAHMLKCLAINDNNRYPSELRAFRTAFQGRRFRLLITNGILEVYQEEANKPPPIQIQPVLNNLLSGNRAIYLEEYKLNRFPVNFSGFFQEHSAFILDGIAAQANNFITNYEPWIHLSNEPHRRYGLQIVNPARFVQLEEN